MTLNKIFPLAGLGIFIFIPNSFALGQIQYVEKVDSPGSFPIVQQGVAANLFVDANDFAGVTLCHTLKTSKATFLRDCSPIEPAV